MDQIYREYSEKYKHILHYAGIMKKENVLFENQEIIVLKDVKDYQDFDYSYFENCEIEKSCIYHKITYALAVLKKVENGIIVDQMKTVGWLNTVLDQHYSAHLHHKVCSPHRNLPEYPSPAPLYRMLGERLPPLLLFPSQY